MCVSQEMNPAHMAFHAQLRCAIGALLTVSLVKAGLLWPHLALCGGADGAVDAQVGVL